MKIYLAGTAPFREIVEPREIMYVLESYYYFEDWQHDFIKNKTRGFLLDSGAFTFMTNSSTHVNWDEYIEGYADFIKRYNVKHFFELDIDSVVGYPRVKQMRKRLETLTGRQCIPVWHKARGVEEWRRMADEYPYIAIGGIVSKEIRTQHYKALPALITEAHKRGAKVHGLGFTNTKMLSSCHFDSVDSTSWTSGRRFGSLHEFRDGRIVATKKQEGKRVTKLINEYNLDEWIKFQKYADTHL